MTESDKIQIYDRAIDVYGLRNQEDICIEEMSELSKAILKYRRLIHSIIDGSKRQKSILISIENIAEEVADVLITIDQLMYFYGISESVERWKESKLKRLDSRLKKEESRNAERDKHTYP